MVTKFFSELKANDWLTLIFSASALIVSISSFWQKTSENRLALRKQLTDLIEALTDLDIELGRITNKDFPTDYSGLLNDQRGFLVRQAAFIATQIEDLVNPYEYLVIAEGFANISDPQAAKFFELAVSSSTPESVERGLAIRGYGAYLFSDGQLDAARHRFEEALAAFAGNFDRLRYYRAVTYERWAALEREWQFPKAADSLFECAITEYRMLSNPTRRDREVQRLRDFAQTQSAMTNPKTSEPPNEDS